MSEKRNDGIKKQFTLKEELANFVELSAKKSKVTQSEIVNEAIAVYLNLFYTKKENFLESRILGQELKKICETGGRPWQEVHTEEFSVEAWQDSKTGEPHKKYKEEASSIKLLSMRQVIEMSCTLFTRLYREGVVGIVENEAKKLKRSSFATICHIIQERNKDVDRN